MDFQEIKAKTDRYLFHNYGRQPIAFTHGSGCYLYDTKGREYLDLVAGIAVNALGYAHPDWTRAVQEQVSRMTHVSNLYYIAEQAELAERIASITPGDLDRTLFVNSGAEANEGALKLAVRYTGRGKVLSALDGFHGRTSAAMAAPGGYPCRSRLRLGAARARAGPRCSPGRGGRPRRPGDRTALRPGSGTGYRKSPR